MQKTVEKTRFKDPQVRGELLCQCRPVQSNLAAGRPLRRWDDDLVALAGDDWPVSALDETLWDAAAAAFINDTA